MVNWLKHVLDNEWLIRPAGGLTGDAFIAEKGEKRLFLKRNSAPFLAVLSAQGIVPKLIWTKRMANGDVVTAQKWLEGRKLRPEEMKSKRVIDILQKIHHSPELLHMLMRLGKKSTTPIENYEQLVLQFSNNNLAVKYDLIKQGLSYLEQLLPITEGQEHAVCHNDLNHNNLMITKEDQLYLIDWDNVKIADPMIDFGMILKWYVPESKWDIWLEKYGIVKDNQFIARMHWYLLYNILYYIHWHDQRNEWNKVLEQMNTLKEMNEYIEATILN